MRARAMAAAVMVWGILGATSTAWAEPPERDVDFSGGFVVNQAPSESFESFPGVTLQARYFATDWLYVAGVVSGDLGFDLRNPESGNTVPMLGLGVGSGLYRDIGTRLTGYAGARVEWLQAWHWPVGDIGSKDFHTGVRVGPTAGISLRVTEAFGHPMSLEIGASYLYYRVPQSEYVIMAEPGSAPETHKGLQVGFFLTGVLFPEPKSTQSAEPLPM